MDNDQYPALYISASAASALAQRSYFNLLKWEYSFLIMTAALAMVSLNSSTYYIIYALIFIAPILLLLHRSSSKPEQAWYKCRALAESIKTSSWRYMMRAEPFEDTESPAIPKSNFRNFLAEILRANKHIGESTDNLSADNHQITERMNTIRGLSLNERKGIYLEQRIKNQRSWYSNKVNYNKKCHRIWLVVCLIVYILAISSVLLRIVFPEWLYWPTEPLIVIASAILGWMQIKKFNELAASYFLTAHEIGIIQGGIDEVQNEQDFSDFINEAELAFSREHTQWVARKD
ncbi:MAG: DUF4231 domain-containing protein [Alphaproteobacteria bacterium]|nr:DUF4231 domain-containing protein [Alphaproteobacteria bacterium]